ncbi:winged helix-turn-helix domain-containing protein [Streptomyces sp. NBC_00829]|uniref:helix-turn-helix domain-containing protein n=1 Tax=Streptomyces sp. NBC_00829 TaxID=2903679 RepID=UPI0038685945
MRDYTPVGVGQRGVLWTRASVKALISLVCGVSMTEQGVGKWLRRHGFPPQRPDAAGLTHQLVLNRLDGRLLVVTHVRPIREARAQQQGPANPSHDGLARSFRHAQAGQASSERRAKPPGGMPRTLRPSNVTVPSSTTLPSQSLMR